MWKKYQRGRLAPNEIVAADPHRCGCQQQFQVGKQQLVCVAAGKKTGRLNDKLGCGWMSDL